MANETAPLKSNVQQLQEELKQTADNAFTLAKTTASNVGTDLKGVAGDVRDLAQQVFNAGLGAFVTAEEEGSKLFKKLVKKGEKVEIKGIGVDKLRAQLGEGADKVADAVKGRAEDAKYMAGEAADKVEDRLQDAVAVVMKRIGVPTRDEVAELTASVERLTQHIERLKAERAVAAKPALAVESVGGGWYEVKVGDVVVDKVQGREDADAALVKLQAQQD
ncbi:MAG TPA: phasin family protein [Rhodothermales bacterium]|nr:phasin family protein [Rhodothermales bacterium]